MRRLSIVTPVAALFFYLAVRTRPTPSTPIAGRGLVLGRRPVAGRDGLRAPELLSPRHRADSVSRRWRGKGTTDPRANSRVSYRPK